MQPALTTVLLVDDHGLFREGMAALLSSQEGIEVIGEAGSGLEGLQKARELLPDLILMDIRMPDMDGLEATRRIKEEMPHTRIIILTVSEEEQDLFEAIKAGAEGYLLKTLRSRELFEALQGVLRGEAVVSRAMASKLLREFSQMVRRQEPAAPPREVLTRRETEVLQLLREGASNKEIAARLCISERTVKNHVHNILEKLQLESRLQAAAYARREGLSERPSN